MRIFTSCIIGLLHGAEFCYGIGMREVMETWARLHASFTVLPIKLKPLLQRNKQKHYYCTLKIIINKINKRLISSVQS
jgi:hypothetical protein